MQMFLIPQDISFDSGHKHNLSFSSWIRPSGLQCLCALFPSSVTERDGGDWLRLRNSNL